MKLKWDRVGGSDLVVSFDCTCPSPSWVGTSIEHLMKNRITLWGYADANFFDNVNKEPREFECNCGIKYSQQWLRNGEVLVEDIK